MLIVSGRTPEASCKMAEGVLPDNYVLAGPPALQAIFYLIEDVFGLLGMRRIS